MGQYKSYWNSYPSWGKLFKYSNTWTNTVFHRGSVMLFTAGQNLQHDRGCSEMISTSFSPLSSNTPFFFGSLRAQSVPKRSWALQQKWSSLLLSKCYILQVGNQPKNRTSSPTLLLLFGLSPSPVGSPTICTSTDLLQFHNCLRMKTLSALFSGILVLRLPRKSFSLGAWERWQVQKRQHKQRA